MINSVLSHCKCLFRIPFYPALNKYNLILWWHCKLLLCMALHWQDTSYQTFYGISSMKNILKKYRMWIIYVQHCTCTYLKNTETTKYSTVYISQQASGNWQFSSQQWTGMGEQILSQPVCTRHSGAYPKFTFPATHSL